MTMPPDPPRDLTPNGAHLGTLYDDVWRLTEAQPAETFRPADRDAARARLRETLLYQPEPVDPCAETLEVVDCGDYLRERIVFSTSPVLRVPAYVLVPKGLSGPAPAVVDLHSHGGMFLFGKEKVVDLGDNHEVMTAYHAANYGGRPTATELVRRGYVVISIDALMFGERRSMVDADLAHGWDRARYSLADSVHLNAQCRLREATIVKALTLAGATWPGVVFTDDLRTVDYLVTRPEVDPNRIGCMGVSMGGYRSLFLGALDTRIRAACVVGFMSTVRSMIHAHLDCHSWVHFLPALHRFLDWPEVAALAAPRCLMVLQCARDGLFPLEGMQQAVRQIAASYEVASCPEAFDGRFYDVPHQFSVAMQDDAMAWFDHVLR